MPEPFARPTPLDRYPTPDPVVVDGLRRYDELVFRSLDGYRPLTLDLVVPDTAGTPPLVVFVHGGAWLIGHRRLLAPSLMNLDIFRRLPDMGYAVATVSYRLSAEAIYPACVEDVAAAISWLRHRAGSVGIDAARIAAWGESAGAYLAVKAGVGGFGADPVQAIISWYAPVDFAAMQEQGALLSGPEGPESRLMGAPIDTVPDEAAAASLVASASPTAPPLLVMHGEADRLIPVAQATMLHDAWTTAGAPVEQVLISGADHTFPGVDESALFEPVSDFLRRHLQPDR